MKRILLFLATNMSHPPLDERIAALRNS